MELLGNTSVAEVYRFIAEYDFAPGFGINPFEELTFSDSDYIRLDPTNFNIRLKKQSPYGYFSTNDDIYFETWIKNPLALRKLLMLQVFVDRPVEETYTQVRLTDGTDHYYWDGAAWSVAGAGNWNTEADINAHIEDFTILPDRKFGVVVNLKTEDKYFTPMVSEIRVLMQIRIDYMEDIVFRSLLPLMKANIQPIANYPLPALESDFTTIDLNDYETDTAFNIVDVDAVFNFSTDSELLYDILDSYDSNTKIITLNTPILAGEIPFILFRYVPEFQYTTNQDYFEVAKIPSVTLQRLEVPLATSYNLSSREGVVDKGTGDAVLVHEPWRATLDFRVHVTTDNSVDEMRLMSSVMKFFEENKLLRSVGLDEYYRMQITKEFRDLISPDRADQHTFWTQFVIMDVRMPFVSEDTKGVTRLITNWKEPEPPRDDDPVMNSGTKKLVFTSITDEGPYAWEESFEITE